MGVTNLWALLEPCGRRGDVQALRGKRVAVDASGWIFRFIKAMRDEQGELLPNAHLIGFFRRICRLLFHNIRPVFIFDGSTPALKKQTVAERRRRREQQESRVRKTAEKLLLNQLKQHALAEMEAARQAAAAGRGPTVPATAPATAPQQSASPTAAHRTQPESQSVDGASGSGAVAAEAQAANIDADAELAAAVAAAMSESDSEPFEFDPQLPMGAESVDPAVLATLPPSMQLEVMLRLRDRQMAANRGEFEQRTGNPEEFSQFQIQQYLKSSNLRRQLDVLRGAGMANGGAARVAAEENVEYVLEKDVVGPGPAEAAAAAAEAAAAAALQEQQADEGGGLHLSFEIKAEDGGSDDSMEWEDIDEDTENAGSGDEAQQGEHWRERAAKRQKYWSRQHGFQMGRKLAQWGEEDEKGAAGGGQSPKAAAGGAKGGDDEDAALQEAIRRSLEEEAAGAGAGEVDLTWDDVEAAAEGTQPVPPQLQQPERGGGGGGGAGAPVEREDSPPRVYRPGKVPWYDVPLLEEMPPPPPPKAAGPPTAALLPMAVEQRSRGAPSLFVETSAALKKAAVPPAVKAVSAEKVAVNAVSTAVQSLPLAPVSCCTDREEELARPAAATTAATAAAEVAGTTPAASRSAKFAIEALVDKGLVAEAEEPVSAVELVEAAAAAAPTSNELLANAPSPPLPAQPAAALPAMAAVPSAPFRTVRFADEQPSAASEPAAPLASSPVQAAAQEETSQQQPMHQVAAAEGLLTNPPPAAAAAPAAPAANDDAGARFDALLTSAVPTIAAPAVPTMDAEELRREETALRFERRAAAGQSDAPTDQMFAECQELLQLFGLPFIIAPEEAEAQAAWLDAAGLVEGVVTDDNDAFLFGARKVYRNIFEDKKYVEEYRSDDVETELGLSRRRLVELALLLGSDYTPGVAGVGVVNAMEVVSAFGGEQGMEKFARWMRSVDDRIVALARATGGVAGGEDGDGGDAADATEEEMRFKAKHNNARKGWTLPSDFPSREVVTAYLDPKVDSSKDRFTFARPDLELLRRFCAQRFGWPSSKTDELLTPVLQAYDARQTQQTLDNFVAHRQRFAKIRSKRLREAVAGITGAENEELALEVEEERTPPKRKRKGKGKKAGGGGAEEGGEDEEADKAAEEALELMLIDQDGEKQGKGQGPKNMRRSKKYREMDKEKDANPNK